VSNARQTVRTGWEVLKACLEETDHLVSAAAAYVITRYPEDGAEVLNLLKTRFERADSGSCLRTGFMMLVKDFVPGVEEWARSVFARETVLPVRIAAAVAIAHAARQQVSADIIDFLAQHLISNDAIDEAYSNQPWDKPEPAREIVDALFLFGFGRRLAMTKFDELLNSQQDKERLRFCDYALRDALCLTGERTESPRR